MGAGASLSKAEAEAAAPGANCEFTDAAWDALEKNSEGKVSVEALTAAASKYALPAAAPAAATSVEIDPPIVASALCLR